MTVAKIDEEVFGTSGVLENIGRGIDDRFTIFLPGSAKGKRLSVIRLHHLGVDIIEAARELEARLIDIGGAAAGYLVEQANAGVDRIRSEEHTSELQTLMRISYAVFCLKKQNK